MDTSPSEASAWLAESGVWGQQEPRLTTYAEAALWVGSHRLALVVRGDIVEFATEDAFLDVRESSMFALGNAGDALASALGSQGQRLAVLTAAAMASPLERFRAARALPRGMP